jgi:DNA mismatch repair protein MutL
MAAPPAAAGTGPAVVPAPPEAPRELAWSAPAAPWKWVRVLGQVAELYVVLETDGGFVVLDPRAARERVLYERLLASRRGGRVASQRLLLPETVQLPPEDAQCLRKHLDVLRDLGFEVDDFGRDRFIVEALPADVAGAGCRELLADIASDLEVSGVRRGSERWREEAVARAACRAGARPAGPWPPEAVVRLVEDLAATQMPYTCPRGRPTMIFTPLRELARKFGRE